MHNDSPNLNTVTNLTNHSYFNLAGEASAAGSANSQYVQINANNYSPTDSHAIPLGTNTPGRGHAVRLPHPPRSGRGSVPVSAGQHPEPTSQAASSQLLIAQGYDHNWVLNSRRPRHRPRRPQPGRHARLTRAAAGS